MTGYEPRWDIEPDFEDDLAYGHQGEIWFASFLDALKHGPVEVKTKSYVDGNFYVEYQCRKGGVWQESGILITDADFWAFVVDDTGLGVVLETNLLYSAFERFRKDPTRHREETDGSHPTKGVLIEFGALLNHAKRMKSPT